MLTAVAEQGDAGAYMILADEFLSGEHLRRDEKRGMELLERGSTINGGCSTRLIIELFAGKVTPRNIPRGQKLCVGTPDYAGGLADRDSLEFNFGTAIEEYYLDRMDLTYKDKKRLLDLFFLALTGDVKATKEFTERFDKAKFRKPRAEGGITASEGIRAVLDGIRDGMNQSLPTLPQR